MLMSVFFSLPGTVKKVYHGTGNEKIYINFPFFLCLFFSSLYSVDGCCFFIFWKYCCCQFFSIFIYISFEYCRLFFYFCMRSKTQNRSWKIYLKIWMHNGPLPGYYWIIINIIFFSDSLFLSLFSWVIHGNVKRHRQDLILLFLRTIHSLCCWPNNQVE